MKKVMIFLFVMYASLTSIAQEPKKNLELGISFNKTTTLVFPYEVIHIDRGNIDIITSQVTETKNMVLVKATSDSLSASNLTIITKDGAIYAFNVHFEANPMQTVFRYNPKNLQKGDGTGTNLNEQEIEMYSKMMLNKRRTTTGMFDESFNVTGRVRGIFIKSNVIFYQLNLTNYSTIGYDIDVLRFYINDKKVSKRTAAQEVEVTPVFTLGETKTIEGKSSKNMIYAFEKFTIPDAKCLWIEIIEKNGGRHLSIQVKNKKIIRAIVLPDLN